MVELLLPEERILRSGFWDNSKDADKYLELCKDELTVLADFTGASKAELTYNEENDEMYILTKGNKILTLSMDDYPHLHMEIEDIRVEAEEIL